MNISDDRKKGSVISYGSTSNVDIILKDGLLVDCNQDNLVIETPTYSEVISLGEGQYLQGPKGDKGDTPQHEWLNTSLRFRNYDNSWGVLTDLKGDKGDKGDQGEKGPTGDIGNIGNPGPVRFTWVKYAASTTPAPEEMFNEPDGRAYIGLAYNKEVDEGQGDPDELNYRVYRWSRIQGEDGNDGLPGLPGQEGPEGLPGEGFTWLGEFEQHPTEADIGRPIASGDTYLNIIDQRVYTYSGGWHLMLESGAQGPAGPSGPQGATGGGYYYQGEFPESPSGALVNWLYKNSNNDVFYTYDGTAWVYATSDGKNSVEGMDSGNGWVFYTTFSSNDVSNVPDRPILDGDSGEWKASPFDHTIGSINWSSQKITQSTDPNQGVWGDPIDISNQEFRGPIGFRGSQTITVPLDVWTGWDDRIAAQAVGGSPQEWDVVTLYLFNDPNIQDTRRYGYNSQAGEWEWLSYNYVFLGDVLVDGSLDAQKINAASELTVGYGDNVAKMSGADSTYRLWAGNITPTLADFRVTQDGTLFAKNAEIEGKITTTDGEFSGYIYGTKITGGLITGALIEGSLIIGGAEVVIPTSADNGVGTTRYLAYGATNASQIGGTTGDSQRIVYLDQGDGSYIASASYTGDGTQAYEGETVYKNFIRFIEANMKPTELSLAGSGRTIFDISHWIQVRVRMQSMSTSGVWTTRSDDTFLSSTIGAGTYNQNKTINGRSYNMYFTSTRVTSCYSCGDQGTCCDYWYDISNFSFKWNSGTFPFTANAKRHRIVFDVSQSDSRHTLSTTSRVTFSNSANL